MNAAIAEYLRAIIREVIEFAHFPHELLGELGSYVTARNSRSRATGEDQ